MLKQQVSRSKNLKNLKNSENPEYSQYSQSGVRIENTLSMALQKNNRSRQKGLLLLVAFTGVFSSIFTFLSMFSLAYSLPVLLTAMILLFAFFSWCAMKPSHSFLPILLAGLAYCVLFFRLNSCISNGLMYLTNTVCQTIYMTDWEYFSIDPAYSQITSVTCILCFLMFPIIWILCFAVLRYQNFFLSLLVTFPFVEIGLFFGIIPNHGFALSLVAFWFAMMAIQMASSGVTHRSKTGFLRRNHDFFPVASMRFMLPETTGISVLCMILALLMLAEGILKATDYTRPEQIKLWRSDFQDYVASLEFSKNIPGTFGNSSVNSEIYDQNQEMIELGSLDERTYQDTPVTSVTFSDYPNSRIYLKYRTGHVYTGTNWTALPGDIYDENTGISSIFRDFENLDYYPEEFLYYTVPGLRDMKMTFSDATDILKKCVPYGFQKNGRITCHHDLVTTETDSYLMAGGADYEQIFINPNVVTSVRLADLWESYTEQYGNSTLLISALAYPDNEIWIRKTYRSERFSNRIQQAGLLCGQYLQFVLDHEIALPANPAMEQLRTAYAELFEDFDAYTATPAETIRELQKIRNRICQDVEYTLSPGKTPADRDHAVYFLLENKQGYCEHYATAGTILARMAGIPARYCEGYMLDCSRPGVLEKTESETGEIRFEAEILDSNAHAWTEIYLNGIGWIPFEFTFSYFTDPGTDSLESITESGLSGLPEMTEFTEFTESSEIFNPEMTTESGIAEFREDLSENRSESKSENTGESSGELSGTSLRNLPAKWIVIVSVLILSALLCLTAFIFRLARLIALRRRAGLFSQDDNTASQAVYAYLTELLSECGVHAHSVTIGELLEESELLCHEFMDSKYSLSIAIQLGAKLRYSPHPLSNGERHYLQRTAEALAQGMYENAKFPGRFYLKWLRHYV